MPQVAPSDANGDPDEDQTALDLSLQMGYSYNDTRGPSSHALEEVLPLFKLAPVLLCVLMVVVPLSSTSPQQNSCTHITGSLTTEKVQLPGGQSTFLRDHSGAAWYIFLRGQLVLWCDRSILFRSSLSRMVSILEHKSISG